MSRDEQIEEYLREFAKLSPEEQALHYSVVIDRIVRALRKRAEKAARAESVNPEMIDADDQDAIDRNFRAMMEGVL